MKPESKGHINFCKAVADGMTYKEAYRSQVSVKNRSSDKSCEQKGSVLAKKYAEHIQNLRQTLSTAIDKAHENSAVKEALKGVMDKAERMNVLTKIARGQIPLKKPVVLGKDIKMIDVVPDWMDRKNAIAELNKMDGSYEPIKSDISFKNLGTKAEEEYEEK